MKKKRTGASVPIGVLSKLWKIMRLSLFFLLLFVAQAFAKAGYSQQTRLTLKMQSAKVLDVLSKIEDQSEFYFLFNQKLVNVERQVNVDVQNESIDKILSALFNGTNVSYVVKDRQIVLTTASNQIQNEQQQKSVSGKVTDSTGAPLPGVSVVIKGTTTGIITDMDGAYTLPKVPADATLVFSFVGMKTQEISSGGKLSINVILEEETVGIEEVVAVGYGTMRKKDLTGSITQIRPDKITIENPKTVQDILRGTPGLQVGMDASAKGGGSMEIRGQRSVYTDGGHNSPLIILDGMLFYGELSEINPDDIGQIDVLKDASAAAIYGAKAANGVLIITTKKGKQGKPVVNFSSNFGVTQKSAYREVFGPDEYLKYRQDFYTTRETYGVNSSTGAYEAYQRGSYGNGYFASPEDLPSGVSIEKWRSYTTNQANESDQSIWAKRLGLNYDTYDNYLAGKTFDWYNHSFRLGINQDYNASLSGASDKVNYYLSMGYLKNQGAQLGDDYNAIRSNMKIEGKVTNWFEIGANVNFQNRSDGNILEDIDEQLKNSPFSTYADASGNPVQYPMGIGASQRGYNYDFEKQYLKLEKGYTVLNSIITAKFYLPFNITYSFNASPRLQWFFDRYFMSAELPGSNPATRGVNREQDKNFDWSINNTLSWDKTFNKQHHVVVTLVQEAEDRKFWSDRIEARKILPSDALEFHNTQNGTKENSTFLSNDTHQSADALLARVFYAYNNRYMVTASVRRDGYSAFGSSNPYATFPSIALAWSFSDEKFFNWKPMSMGKLRVSYGKNGNRSLADPYVSLANLYSGAGNTQGYINSSGQLEQYRYLMVQRMANPNLQWEKTKAWDAGLDFGFLDNRITGNFEYYNMSTHDMIMNQRLPSFTGFSSITTNLGQVNNSGIELTLSTVNIKNDKLEWNTSFGFSYNSNKIKHLYYENQNIVDNSGNVTGSKEMDDTSNGWFIGQAISTIWDYRVTGIWQANEVAEAAKYKQRPGDPKVANNYTADDKVNADGTTTAVYNDKDKEFLGQTAPPIHWSLRNEFTLNKAFSFSFNIYSFMGHKSLEREYLNNDDNGGVVSFGRNIFKKDYWTLDNPTNEYGRIEAIGPVGATTPGRLHDRSFIRLENISVGYSIPQKLTKQFAIDKLKVYGTIRNVAVWAKDWEYGDPETGGLATRIYTLGLNLTF
jgi:TonB-linked outer membrane protein, SusC/RagA family